MVKAPGRHNRTVAVNARLASNLTGALRDRALAESPAQPVKTPLAGAGIWIGLAFALATVAVAMVTRFDRLTRRLLAPTG